MKTITRCAQAFIGPVRSRAFFFAALTLWCSCAPVLVAVFTGLLVLHNVVFALTQSAVAAYLLTLVMRGGKLTAARRVLLVLACVYLTVEAGVLAAIGHPVDVSSVSLVTETTATEVGGFFKQFLTVGVVLKVLCVLVVYIGVAYGMAVIIKALTARFAMVSAALLGAVIVYGSVGIAQCLGVLRIKTYDDYLLWQGSETGVQWVMWVDRIDSSDAYTKAVYLLKSLSLERGETSRWSERQKEVGADVVSSDVSDPSLTPRVIAVLIGESFIKSHSSLYGYPLEVNPRLRREVEEGRLFVFDDIITTANFTTVSLRNMLNLNSISAGEQWSEAVYWPLVVKRLGREVNFFSNQFTSGTSHFGLEGMVCDPYVRTATYDNFGDRNFAYDGEFVEYVGSKFALDSVRPALEIWQLYGQHFPSRDRYPHTPQHLVFTADSVHSDKPWLTDEMRAEVADYANATLYNDSVVAAVLDRYRDVPAVVFYFSDHGEEMWDSAPYGARNAARPDDRQWVHRQFDVPFFVWVSDPLKSAYAEVLSEATRRQGTLDNLGHTILGLEGAKSRYYRPDRDILSPEYTKHPRRTSTGIEYDRGADVR